MDFDNNLRQITAIIYNLKRQYGRRIWLYYPQTITNDVETGEMAVTPIVISIKRAIVLDAKTARDFVYDLSFVAANKNFTYGGHFDAAKRMFIVDMKDIPKTFIIDIHTWVAYAGKLYVIKEVYDAEHRRSVAIVAQHFDGQPSNQIITQTARQMMGIRDEVVNV